MTGAHSPTATVSQPGVQPSALPPCPAVGEALRQRADGQVRLSREEQWQADLDVIERCERDVIALGGCPAFFQCVAELVRSR